MGGGESFGSRTLSGLSSGVAARRAGVLLDVQRAASCMSTKRIPSQHCVLVRISPRSRFPIKSLNFQIAVPPRVVCTDHIDGTECASCCGAFRKNWYPSLFSIVSQCRRRRKFSASGGVGVGRTHFACLSMS